MTISEPLVLAFTYDWRQVCDLLRLVCYVRQMHGRYDPGAGPDPEDVLAGQEGRDPETGGLVLTDDVVAT